MRLTMRRIFCYGYSVYGSVTVSKISGKIVEICAFI